MNEKKLYFKSALASKWINLLGSRKKEVKSILVVKRDEIGDLVTALHVFKLLHEAHPKAHITLYCKSFNTIFFKYIDYVTAYTDFSEIEKKKFDVIADLRGDEQTLNFALKNKPNYRVDRGTVRLYNKFFGGQKNEMDTNLQIVSKLIKKPHLNNEIVYSNKEVEKVNEFIEHENLSHYALIHVGSRQAVKKWPLERFVEVIGYINAKYNYSCLLIGSKEDIEENNRCLSQVKSKINYSIAGEFNLLEFAVFCSKASLYLGNDSGPLHIAASYKIPTIALFSAAVKGVWYPRGNHVRIHHYFLSRNHTQQTVENSTIYNIKVDEVKDSIDDLLQQST